LAITETQRPGAARINQRQLQVYRPAVSPNSALNNHNPLPGRVRTINEVTANGGIRRVGVANDNSGGSNNSGLNQNNTNTGTAPGNYRNGSLNNGANGRYNNSNNTIANPAQSIGNPATTDRNERIERAERLRQYNRQANPNSSQVAGQVQPQNNQNDRMVTPPVRRFQQPTRDIQQNNNGEGTMTPTQRGQNNEQLHNQYRDRIQRLPSNNQNQNAPAFQNNRNIERSQNIPQRDNNSVGGQPSFPSPGQGVMQNRAPAMERNIQQMPAHQNTPGPRANLRARERS